MFSILCYGAADTVEGRCQRAASAGAIEAVVSAMSLPTHAVEGQGDVQTQGCAALANLCVGSAERRTRAVGLGALEAVVRAGEADGMAAHALRQICGEDEALRRRAVDMGAEARVFGG